MKDPPLTTGEKQPESSNADFPMISMEQAIDDIKNGKMVIVVDDENRENEGDFVLAAAHISPEKVNFLLKYARGMICVPVTRQRQHQLELYPMVSNNTAPLGTNFTVTVDAHDVSTGISSYDRYLTIKTMVNEKTRPSDLLRPGHINPLIARDGGVMVRAGHTEAAVDLARLAGLPPIGVICEILKDDGTMARLPDLVEIAKEHNMGIITIEELIRYRKDHERLIRQVAHARIPNVFGEWTVYLYENIISGEEHQVLVMGEPEKQDSALVRVHSKCFTGDVLMSNRCDCGPQLFAAMEKISKEGHGVIVYMNQEGRGIGLKAKLMAYNLQDQGFDTVQANEKLGFKPDLREYGIGAQILTDLGLHRVRLMTNNPKKIVGIRGHDLEIVDRESLTVGLHKENERYLKTKAERMGHTFNIEEFRQMNRELEQNEQPLGGVEKHGVPTSNNP